MSTARYYDPSRNEEERSISGVALADISEEEWERQPPHIQETIDASGFFFKSPRPKQGKPTRKTDEPPAAIEGQQEE